MDYSRLSMPLGEAIFRFHPAAGLADAMTEVPCIVFAFALPGGTAETAFLNRWGANVPWE